MKTYVETSETKVGNESCYKVTKVSRFRVYKDKLKAWAERRNNTCNSCRDHRLYDL